MRKSSIVGALAAAATLSVGLVACDDGPSRQEIAAQEQAVEDAEKRAQEAEEAAEQARQEAEEAQEAADTAKVEESTPEPEPEESYEFTAEDEVMIVETALDMTWAETPASDQVDICMGWDLDEEWALDMMSDGYETEVLSMGEVREIMRDFFDEKCG